MPALWTLSISPCHFATVKGQPNAFFEKAAPNQACCTSMSWLRCTTYINICSTRAGSQQHNDRNLTRYYEGARKKLFWYNWSITLRPWQYESQVFELKWSQANKRWGWQVRCFQVFSGANLWWDGQAFPLLILRLSLRLLLLTQGWWWWCWCSSRRAGASLRTLLGLVWAAALNRLGLNPDVTAADVSPTLLPKLTERDGSLDVKGGGSGSEGRQRGWKSVARADLTKRCVVGQTRFEWGW